MRTATWLLAGLMAVGATAQAPTDPPVADYVSKTTGMKFKLIKAGTGVFGEGAKQTTIAIDQPFHLGVYTVTQSQWQKAMGTTPWKDFISGKEGANCPATFVGWYDATAFCKKLGKLDGVAYRLPTEQEWEYACRAGTTTRYSFGDDPSKLGDYAWFRDNASKLGVKHAQDVGMKLPNPWGLHDMHGNVQQWTSTAEGADRVLRGGGWGSSPLQCGSAHRFWESPASPARGYSFRVVASSVR
jgi:formylglycine-generating enzyme required for sulfatase activity